MEPNYQRRKIMLLAGIVLFIVAAIGSLVFLLRPQSTNKLALSQPFASNIAHPAQIDSNTIYYFTNSGFAAYNLQNHTTQPLTPQYSLPSHISDVAISKTGALFRATGYSSVDRLYAELVKARLDPNVDYWWQVSFADGSIRLLGNPTTDALVRSANWQDDQHFVYAEQPAPDKKLQIIQRTIQGSDTQLGTITDEAIVVAATPQSILFTLVENQKTNLHRWDIASKKSTPMLNNIVSVLASSSNGSVLAITESPQQYSPENPRGPLVLYNASTAKTTQIAPDFEGRAAWNTLDDQWLAVGFDGNRKPLGFMGSGAANANKPTAFTFKQKTAEKISFTPLSIKAGNLLLVDSIQQLYYASKQLPGNLPTLPNYSQLTNNIDQPTFSTAYDSNLHQYNVYITANPYKANQDAAIAYLQGLHYDPNQLKIKWYAYDGVTTGFELPADVIPNYVLEPLVPDDPNVGD
jgi:hypothetical protein